MAIPTMTNNSPVAGSIAWGAFSIKYDGVEYGISAGSTLERWVWWRYNAGDSVIEGGSNVPTDLTDDDLVLFGNKNGIGARVQSSTLVDGELLVDGSIFAAAIATGAIVAGKIAAGAVTTNSLRAGAVTADAIETEALYGKKMIGGLVASAETGRRVEQDLHGFRLWDENEVALIDFPTTLDGVNHFAGDIDAFGMTIQDQLLVKAGAKATLSNGIAAPGLAPGISTNYLTSAIPDMKADIASGSGIFTGGEYIWCTWEGKLTSALPNGSPGSVDLQLQAIPGPTRYLTSFTKIGAYYYGLVYDSPDAVNVSIFQFDAVSGNIISSLNLGALYVIGVIATDGTNLYHAYSASATNLTVKVYTPVLTAVGTPFVKTNPAYVGGLSALLVGNFDYGSQRIIVVPAYTPNGKAYHYTGSGAILTAVPNDDFVVYSGNQMIWAMFWDGSYFRSWASGLAYQYSAIKWTTESDQWWASYAWNNTVGGNQTTQGPRVKFTMIKRRFLTFSLPAIPTDLGANSAITFLGRGAADPGSALMWHPAAEAPGIGVRGYTYGAVPFSFTAGTHPLTVGTFADTGIFAKLASGKTKADLVTPLWSLNGDGTWDGLPGLISTTAYSTGDFSASTTIATAPSFPTVVGKIYRITAGYTAQQISATGTPFCFFAVDGVEKARLLNGASTAANVLLNGIPISYILVGDGANHTATVRVQTNVGGSQRVLANGINHLTVEKLN